MADPRPHLAHALVRAGGRGRTGALVCLGAAAAGLWLAGPAAPAFATTDASAHAARIEAATAQLRDDPLVAGKHKRHKLEWTPSEDDDDQDKDKDKAKPDTPTRSPGSTSWLASFGQFVSDSSRLLVYGLAAVLVAVLLVSARHFVQLRAFRKRAERHSVVSHVRDLDVRPQSLPDDVGTAAWKLWQAGQVTAALSLLYRGALSRLIHRHDVPIESSSTEGECLVLARGRIDDATHRYLTQVVRAWEANIYGNRALSPAMGEALCGGFMSRMDAAPVLSSRAETPGVAT